jgi:hypothetical protein
VPRLNRKRLRPLQQRPRNLERRPRQPRKGWVRWRSQPQNQQRPSAPNRANPRVNRRDRPRLRRLWLRLRLRRQRRRRAHRR